MSIDNACLYINFRLSGNYGGGKYNETILCILKELYCVVDVMSFPAEIGRGQLLLNTMCGYLNGMDATFMQSAIRQLDANKYNMVFLASSNFGKLAKAIKASHPEVKLCVLFNNIELNFIKSQLSVGFKPQLLATLAATFVSERNVAKHADLIIVLNDRENAELHRIYGRHADAIIPIVLKDELAGKTCSEHGAATARQSITGLFVGSHFYANVHAVEWFAMNVVPRLKDTKVIVVGKGFEAERHLQTDTMQIIGTVDDVGSYYSMSDFVIAPIFKGAGMKVKVAEAMMYGKTIIGTPEAFEGYRNVGEYGIVCNTADEFVSAINGRKFPIGTNALARNNFLKHYEYSRVKCTLAKLLNS